MPEQENNIKRGKIANCVILHDFVNPKPNLITWVNYVTKFFKKYNVIPNRLGGHNKKATKNISFINGVRALEKNNYDTEDIWIGALPPKHNSDMFCAIFSASIVINTNNTSCDLYFDDAIVKFDIEYMNKLAQDLANICGAKYGYAFQRPFSQIVGYYAGTISGLEYGEPEREFITKWNHEYRLPDGRYKRGDLRDIYPINILSKTHMERIIHGMHFKKWIESDNHHGYLIQLDNDLWSWHVTDEQIPSVRESLRNTGMVLCIQNFVAQIFTPSIICMIMQF